MLPNCVHALFCGVVHFYFVGPAASVTLFRPLARGVHAHLRTEILAARGMVQSVHRTENKLDIALGILNSPAEPSF